MGSGSVVSEKRRRTRAVNKPKGTGAFCRLPTEVLDKIVDQLVNKKAAMSVILLGMVNKECHLSIRANTKAWFQLYLQWRGPLSAPRTGPIRTAHGHVTWRHALPRHLPNFRDTSPSIM